MEKLNSNLYEDPDIPALIEASTLINSTLELDKVLELIMKSAARVMRAQASSVMLIDEEKDELFFEIATGEKGDVVKDIRFPIGQGIAGWVAETGESILAPDVYQNPHFSNEVDKKTEFETRSIVCVPLKVKGNTIGVVEVLNKINGNFTQRDLDIFVIFANLAAVAIENAKLYEELRLENRGLKKELELGEIVVGQSEAMKSIFSLVDKVADSDATVLLRGETGTGKEIIARAIHKQSPRRDKPFICVDCSAFPESLLESELFGHEKSAFTGAGSRVLGRFELADKGTLFLDEVGEIIPKVQVKLLRFLQNREFERLGGAKTIRSDVRVIAATNRDLSKAINEKVFRTDLYYRLNVVPIFIPPLRRRKEDIPLFVDHFIRKYSIRMGKKVERMSKEALDLLINYSWPGNIRELENIIERAIIISGEKIVVPEHLPREIFGVSPQIETGSMPKVKGSLWDMEKDLIQRALEGAGWNQTKAAQYLGISRDNLRYRMKKYGIRKN